MNSIASNQNVRAHLRPCQARDRSRRARACSAQVLSPDRVSTDVASIVLLPPSWLDDDDGEDLLHQTHLAPVWQPLHDQGRHGSSLDAPLPAQGDAPRHHARARGSPAAFMRRIKACNNVGELDAVLSEQSLPVYYNVRHAAAALTHMAQLLTRQTQQPPQHHTEQSPQPPPLYTHVSQPLSSEPQAHVASSLVHRLVQRLWAGRHELQARQVANVTWALGALHPHTSPQSAVQLVTFLCDWAGRHTDEFQPQELSSMLHGLATFGVAPPSIAWVCGVLGAVERALPCMTPQGVANSVWALSHWLATAHTQVAAPHAADTAHALSDLAYDSSAPQHGAEWVGVGGWQVLVGKASARHVITHTLRDTLHTRAAVLMDAVWAVSGAHLPEGGCCPGPATVACSDSPWPVRTLVLVAWSCARMRILPPPVWQEGLAAATFAALPHLSSRDVCHLAWTTAWWRQLATEPHAITAAAGHSHVSQPALQSQAQSWQQHQLQQQRAASGFAIPAQWLTRLRGLVCESVARTCVARVRRMGPGPNRSGQPASQLQAGMTEHSHALPSLLWAAQPLGWQLTPQQRAVVVTCALRQPAAFSSRELILIAGWEARRAAILTERARKESGAAVSGSTRPQVPRTAGTACRLQPPVQTATAPAAAGSSTGRSRVPAQPQQGVSIPANTKRAEQDSRIVNDLIWAAACQLTAEPTAQLQPPSQSELQQRRVDLVSLLRSAPRPCVATCRKVWRAVRAGLGRVGPAPAFTARQASQLLVDITQTGYRAPPADLDALVALAVTPVARGEGTDAEALMGVAWACVSAARAARLGLRHRQALVSRAQARRRWAQVADGAHAALSSPGGHHHTLTQAALRADAAAMVLWSLVDMSAHTATAVAATAALVKKPAQQPATTPSQAQAKQAGVLEPRLSLRVLLKKPRLAVARPRGLRLSVTRGNAVSSQTQRHVLSTKPVVSPEALTQWLLLCAAHAPNMSPRAVVLMASAADRVGRHAAMASADTRRALMSVLEATARRLPAVMSGMGSEELLVCASHVVRLAVTVRQMSARHDSAQHVSAALRTVASFAFVFECECERRSATLTAAQAARVRSALARMQQCGVDV